MMNRQTMDKDRLFVEKTEDNQRRGGLPRPR